MELWNVPRDTLIRVVSEEDPPPGGLSALEGETLFFRHIDGMYSLCIDEEGRPVHLKAWTEVEIVTDE